MTENDVKANLGTRRVPPLRPSDFPDAGAAVQTLTSSTRPAGSVDIMLVNPPSPDGGIWIRSQHRVGRRSRENMIWPQVSLAQLASLLVPDYTVDVVDCIATRMTWEEFEKLIDDFEMDQIKSQYETDEEVLEYCSGSADPVGRILLYLAGRHDRETSLLSDSICSGLQITNFCQDVRRDAERNRIYLPKTYWISHGLDQASILAGNRPDELRNALSEWSTVARNKLVFGLPLVRLVPLWLARDLQLFVRGGLCLLDELDRSGYDSWNKPIAVPKLAKLRLILRAWISPRSTVP